MVDPLDPLDSKKPTTKFTNNILKQIVGVEKAANAFNSISMASIPQNKDKSISLEGNSLATADLYSVGQSKIFKRDWKRHVIPP